MRNFVLVVMTVAACGGGAGGSNKQTMLSAMLTAQEVPVDQNIEGVWNDINESSIALVHKEGDEYRILFAMGDTRANVPATDEEAKLTNSFLPGKAERERAAAALKSWKAGATPPQTYLFAMAGKAGSSIDGTWADGNDDCNKTNKWGNFAIKQLKQKDGKWAMTLAAFATLKTWPGGYGGNEMDFSRLTWLAKSKKPIPPSILEQLKKADNFCRKTAKAEEPAKEPAPAPAAP